MTEQNQTLTVRMLGGFSLSYQGEEIVLGRNTTAKFVQLLQLLWLRGDKGISKQQIVRCLYEDDEQADGGCGASEEKLHHQGGENVYSGPDDSDQGRCAGGSRFCSESKRELGQGGKDGSLPYGL